MLHVVCIFFISVESKVAVIHYSVTVQDLSFFCVLMTYIFIQAERTFITINTFNK